MPATNRPSHTSRRTFLAGLSALGLSALAPWPLVARAALPKDAWRSAFAPYDGAPNTGFDGTIASGPLNIRGKWPAELSGTLYRNGPARTRLGATQYQHWFDGDGMIQAFSFDAGQVHHRGVLLATPKRLKEDAAGRFLYPAFGTTFADALPVSSADAINVANINLLAMRGGRDLYALWEAGSALQIDPATLQNEGFKVWSPDTAGAPFSAHPRTAPDGEVWSFGYAAGSGRLIIYQIGADGVLKRQALLDAPQADMVHDFAITDRYLVFLLMPMSYQRETSMRVAFADQFHWHADRPLLALVVDKSDFSTRRYELPTDGVFHIGNAHEEAGTIRVGYASQPSFMALIQNPTLPVALHRTDSLPSSWKEVELDLASTRPRVSDIGVQEVEFPRFDSSRTGQKSELTILAQRDAAMPDAVAGFNSVVVLADSKPQHFSYGPSAIAEEHIYVGLPGHASERDGWIVGTSYNWKSEKTTLSVFSAAHLSAGPIASAELPYGLPLGLHGQFVRA